MRSSRRHDDPRTAVFQANGCFGCHRLAGVGGSMGPALDSVGLRLDAESLKLKITDQKSIKPGSLKPELRHGWFFEGMNPAQIEKVRTFYE